MTESTKPEKPDLTGWLHEVVSAEAEATTEALIVEAERKPTCFPHRFVLDGKARKVTCGRCAQEFLPYDALDCIARSWRDYATNLTIIGAGAKAPAGVRDPAPQGGAAAQGDGQASPQRRHARFGAHRGLA